MVRTRAELHPTDHRFCGLRSLEIAFVIVVLILLFTIGCGGGSSSASPSSNPTTPTTPTPTPPTPTPSSACTTSSTSTCDGPAELPRTVPATSLASTPAPGPVVHAGTTDDLQTDIDNAVCGEVLVLPAGAVYSGNFTLSAKNCDAQHWIWIESGGTLPDENTRISPSYAGVTSLPGRPAFSGPGTNQMAQITTPNSSPAIQVGTSASYYRLIGLEITRPVGGYVAGLMASGGPSSSIILDRGWLHGTTSDETGNGWGVDGTTNFAVINSYFSDIKCTSVVGSCVESHDIVAGGANPTGPGKIYNNFLESASISVLFGGSSASYTPADITVEKNHFFKPLVWQLGNPNFQGGSGGNAFIIKNHLECKNCQRMLVDSNIFENTWSGQSDQSGWSVLMTAKNQSGPNGTNLCDICEVTDITFRFNEVKHVGGGFEVGNGESDNGGIPLDGERFSFHDDEFDDIETNLGTGAVGLVGNSPKAGVPPLKHLEITHVTAYPSSLTLFMGGPLPKVLDDFTFINNLIQEGASEIQGTGVGSSTNCAYGQTTPTQYLNACWSTYNVTSNGFVNGRNDWPSGNNFPATVTDGVQIMGTDGAALGANQSALTQAIQGVE
jgi:hypothetical protein